jgi:hypothetical protein
MSRRIDFKKFYKNQTFIFVENLATEIKLNTHFFVNRRKMNIKYSLKWKRKKMRMKAIRLNM